MILHADHSFKKNTYLIQFWNILSFFPHATNSILLYKSHFLTISFNFFNQLSLSLSLSFILSQNILTQSNPTNITHIKTYNLCLNVSHSEGDLDSVNEDKRMQGVHNVDLDNMYKTTCDSVAKFLIFVLLGTSKLRD